MSRNPILDYSADLHSLAQLVAVPHATGDVLDRALDALRGVIPYDLAAIFRLKDGVARVVASAGPLSSPKVQAHALDLADFPTIRRALETRRPIPLEAHHHHSGEGDPFDGILDLPHGHACMVVPLFAGDRSLGLITLDQQVCGAYPPAAVEIAGVYGQLISLALLFADQAALLDRYRHQLREHNRLLQEETGGTSEAVARLLESPSMRPLTRTARQVAASSLPVLILGETGTGKELVAQAIHSWSPRVDGPFVKLNCSAIPETLVESELFGHVRGAFTGAERNRQGRFLIANGGTLLLDEIGDLPLSAQAKLLRVLQEGTFEPVGSDRTVRVDVRVVAATHVDLQAAVAEGRFREDLYYRLAVFPLQVPPLRERPEDIEAIAEGFLARGTRRTRNGPWTLSASARAQLLAAPWPGNVRELLNALERATLLQPSGTIEPEHLALHVGPRISPPSSTLLPFKEQEKRYLQALMEATDGKLYGEDGAAAIAELPPTTLRSKLVRHGLR